MTDDTEQTVLLGRLLVDGHGRVDPHEFAAALVSWERTMAERGSLDLLGPSTKRAVAAILAGAPPEEAGRFGTTNGAAMRRDGRRLPRSDGVPGAGARGHRRSEPGAASARRRSLRAFILNEGGARDH